MKYLKKFNKLFETGEWNRNIDLNYVLENPDCDEEECGFIKYMYNKLYSIEKYFSNKNIFELIDIRGIDLYQGSYASVKIFGKNYQIYNAEEAYMFWIENFPVDNSSQNGFNSGFMGHEGEISELINDIKDFGGDPEKFNDIKKYNL